MAMESDTKISSEYFKVAEQLPLIYSDSSLDMLSFAIPCETCSK